MNEGTGGVKDELRENAALKAIQSGGILHTHVEKGPMEVLCVPRQSFLDASGLSPYLMLPTPSSSDPNDKSSTTFSVGDKTAVVTPDRYERAARVIREQFLDHHLAHFDGPASPAFVTARGHRGAFSADLKRVTRHGCIGASAVLFELGPLLQQEDTSVPIFHPCKLNIFVISRPLMDDREVENTLSALRLIFFPPKEELSTFLWSSTKPLSVETTPAAESKDKRSVFSRETIAIYQHAVADDNDVQFEEFQRIMELPVCSLVAKTLSNVVKSLLQRETPLFDNSDVKRAMNFFGDRCREVSFFLKDKGKLNVVLEGFEKYVMTELYSRSFGILPEEQERDAELRRRLCHLSPLVKAEELDAVADVEHQPLWDQAMFELEAMNFFKSPRDKLRCAVRAWNQVADAVSAVLAQKKKTPREAEGGESNLKKISSLGADELLPCFLLLVLRARPEKFYLNTQYIKRFRSADIMTSEESYCLANLESAAEFWLSYTAADPPLRSAPSVEADETSGGLTRGREGGVGADVKLTSPSSGARSSTETVCGSSVEAKGDRIDVATLLLRERKSFDDLTVAELRAIVELARSLLAEKCGSSSVA